MLVMNYRDTITLSCIDEHYVISGNVPKLIHLQHYFSTCSYFLLWQVRGALYTIPRLWTEPDYRLMIIQSNLASVQCMLSLIFSHFATYDAICDKCLLWQVRGALYTKYLDSALNQIIDS